MTVQTSAKVKGTPVTVDIKVPSYYAFHIVNPVVDSTAWYDRMDMSTDIYTKENVHGVLGQSMFWPAGWVRVILSHLPLALLACQMRSAKFILP